MASVYSLLIRYTRTMPDLARFVEPMFAAVARALCRTTHAGKLSSSSTATERPLIRPRVVYLRSME